MQYNFFHGTFQSINNKNIHGSIYIKKKDNKDYCLFCFTGEYSTNKIVAVKFQNNICVDTKGEQVNVNFYQDPTTKEDKYKLSKDEGTYTLNLLTDKNIRLLVNHIIKHSFRENNE